jgi:methylated-DNA-[protein]-cysteine S-methyltransferase
MTLSEQRMDTPLGSLRLVASETALVGLYWPRHAYVPKIETRVATRHEVLAKAMSQLEEYFAGQRMEFDLPLDPQGTEFQRAVWKALTAIPFGEIRSYAGLASALGRPTASRAVGAANGRNPLSIVVPCHRVIGGDGTLTGYAGGLDAKRWLLRHEGVGLSKVTERQARAAQEP